MSDFDKQVNDLLTQAMRQPGVAEIVQAFDGQRAAIEAHNLAQAAVSPRWVVFSSSSSANRS